MARINFGCTKPPLFGFKVITSGNMVYVLFLFITVRIITKRQRINRVVGIATDRIGFYRHDPSKKKPIKSWDLLDVLLGPMQWTTERCGACVQHSSIVRDGQVYGITFYHAYSVAQRARWKGSLGSTPCTEIHCEYISITNGDDSICPVGHLTESEVIERMNRFIDSVEVILNEAHQA